MTILTLNKKELEESLGKIDDSIKDKISMFGTPIEYENQDEISIEVFPNRPDLLSFEGFTRSFLTFLGKIKQSNYKVEKNNKDYKVIVDNSVKSVRPYTVCAIIRGLRFDKKKVAKTIDIQEKLHLSYGRNRKKIAIGIYPLEKIKFPIKFLAKKPEEIKFTPLGMQKEINGKQILSNHPAGKEYRHLLDQLNEFPIFEDSNNEILSMPPIINSEKIGKINEDTKDIFIECSGFNLKYLEKALNIIVCSFFDLGGKIYPVEIYDNNVKTYPNLDSEKIEFTIDYINKNLGLNLKEKEIRDFLSKMGIAIIKEKEKLIALIPSYRTDIIHKIDLVEEVAIAYGYDKFKPEIPAISTIGEEDKKSILNRKLSEILIGLGLQEISSYHLSTKEKQFKLIGIKEFKNKIIEILDSKTEKNILRNSLFANAIDVLSENSNSAYPQKFFEIGRVFYHDNKSEAKIGEEDRICIVLCHENTNFTEIKQILDYITKMLSLEYQIKETEKAGFIDGRCGEIIINGEKIGDMGEVSPVVLKNSRIKMPVSLLEICLEKVYINKNFS